MKDKLYRLKNSIMFETGKMLSFYKGYLLVFFIVFLIFFITGIMTSVHYLDSITYEHLINDYLLEFLTKERGFWGYTLILSAWYLGVCCFVIFTTRNGFFVFIDGIILSLGSYIFGFDVAIMVVSFGLSGVIFGIFVQGFLGVLLFFLIILIMSVATKRYIVLRKNCSAIDKNCFGVYITIIILGIGIIVINSIVFSVIHIFVIVD